MRNVPNNVLNNVRNSTYNLYRDRYLSLLIITYRRVHGQPLAGRPE